jgi:hypothetical protein
MGRRTPQDDGHQGHHGHHGLAIRTDLRGKQRVAAGHGRGGHSEHGHSRQITRAVASRPRTPSFSSAGSEAEADAADAEEQVHTHLSASSAGHTDISSTSGISHSTAATSALTHDDEPSAADPTSPSASPHAHPSLTVLELVSNSASASALPDTFDFNVSRKGNFVAIYTSSNIWLIKTTQLPRLWARTLQVKRKPVAIDLTEDGFLLAVLSRPSQVDLYEIHGEHDSQIRKRRTVMLVHEANSIVISPDGLILITGNKFGIEVIAIGPDAPETSRRTLSAPVGDTLEFSDDGRTLLITGYARKSGGSSLFILPGLYDGPLNQDGEPEPQAPETIWTGSVLFPETTKTAKQATLLPDADTGQVNELFAFNSQEDTWGVYDMASQRFTQRKMFLPDQQRWTRSEFIDDAMPTVSPDADLAAVALRMRGTTSIWIYQVPEWDFKSTSKTDQSPIQPCFCIPILNEGSDTYQEICTLRWVSLNSNIQRLVAVGNSNTVPADEVPGAPAGSKGVIIVLDFDKSKAAGSPVPIPTRTEYDLDPLCPGEMLPEGSIDFEREVELVRTRTIAQRRAQAGDSRRHSRSGPSPGRAHTTVTRDRPVSIRQPIEDDEELTAEEAQAAFEMPYDNQQPRSQLSLARAATVAAVSPANRRHLRALPFRPLEYRRADGLREFPHESDADNWVPPPPAYTATAEAAHSVSLSHPTGAPAPTTSPNLTSRIPPVPTLPSHIRPAPLVRPGHPYQSRGSFQSQSSTDLTTPSSPRVSPPRVQSSQARRPSLLHPLTFPSPQSVSPGRRRSSTSQSQSPLPQSSSITALQHHPNQSAYQATSSLYAAPRPNLRSRRAIESSVDLRLPPVVDPSTGRRGSAPDALIPRRPLPAGASPNRVSMPIQHVAPVRSAARRTMLPRLSTFGDSATRREPGPLSAPPRAQTRPVMRVDGRGGLIGKDDDKSPKIRCIVM